MEDGSLPHASSREDDDELEEERRLAYVGMTRAKDRLTLSYALRRMVRGEWMNREPSPFLEAIPESVLEREDMTSGFGRGARPGIFLEGEEGGQRGSGGRPSFGPGGGALFPDYENESQEVPPFRSSSTPSSIRSPIARRPAYVRSVMKRTPPPPTASGFRRGARVIHPDYGS